ncbi:MAG: hypothetical protein PHI98_00700 [Eubacteriales bacterium]|nr:hypothetical protein [Eubacteriales bacterium]
MKSCQLTVISQYGTENENIEQILMNSFRAFLEREMKKSSDRLASHLVYHA